MPDRRPSPGRRLQKLAARFRRRGSREVILHVAGSARARLWSSDSVVILRTPSSSEQPDAGGLEVRFARESDAVAYERDIATDSRASFAARLEHGTRCLLVLADERIQHASWVTTEGAWMGELRRYFVPPPGHAYVYESFTRPETRGRGIYPLALRTLAGLLAADGLTCLWIAVESGNAPSLRAIEKAGFEPVCRASVRRRAGIVKVDATPLGAGTDQDCWVLCSKLTE